jgi:glutamate/aspartate transport system substrate-binding protein
MKLVKHTLVSLLAVCWLSLGSTAYAQGAGKPAPSGGRTSETLDKINEYGAIYLAHRESSLPFSYMDNDGKVLGYSWDLCMHLTDAIKVRLNRPDLAIVPVPVTSSSRQLIIESGVTDLECGSTTNTEQRQRYVAFSVSTFVVGVKALVKKDSGIRSIKDMRGKTVVTTAGTTSDTYVKTAAAKQGFTVNFRVGREHAESIHQVLIGQADAMVLDDVLLQGLLLNTPEADAYKLVVLEENFGTEPYAIMMRRDDPVFKKLVDDTLVGLMKSGELAQLYAKWFTSPIPPKGGNLNLPMSEALKKLIVNPNDKGV